MRKLIHKIIDVLFDLPEDIYRYCKILIDIIILFFKSPKYKIGQIVDYYGTKRITNYYKDYTHCTITYSLENSDYYISEGVIDFYNKEIMNV